MHTLDDLLLALLRQAKPDEPVGSLRNVDLVQTFGVDASLLSKVRSGAMPLTETQARKIVRQAGGTKTDVENLLAASAALMRHTRATKTPERMNASEVLPNLFRGLPSSENAIVMIEVRNVLQTKGIPAHADLAHHVAAAIAGGVSVALFQPFGTLLPPHSSANAFGLYVNDVIAGARMEYRRYYVLAIEKWLAARGLDAHVDWAQGSNALRGRLVLYEMAGTVPLLSSGLGSRSLYIEGKRGEEDDRVSEVWNWFGKKPLLLRRDDAHLDPKAIFDQFAPVSTYWHMNARLPATQQDVADAYACYAPASDWDTGRRWTPHDG